MQQKNSSNNNTRPSSYDKLTHKFIVDDLRRKRTKKNLKPEEHKTKAPVEPSPGPASKKVEEKVPTQQKAPNKNQVIKQPTVPLNLDLPEQKKYFRIGEAADLVGVEPYVLRYWESEFHAIRPMKSKSGHRVYSRKDLKLFEQIRNLLYVEKFSVRGAKKQLSLRRKQETQETNIKQNTPSPSQPTKKPLQSNKAQLTRLNQLVNEIKSLVQIAESSPGNL